MNLYTIASVLLKLIGLGEWFEGWWQRRESKHQAKEETNVIPLTRQQELDDIGNLPSA